ncbi:hypothetical protein FPV67DRAFT_1459721 [Lyophyllum atratum]|nr:hypothetical protein FPV67DRAFT_1459721 [Lyophyllum atratum]
MFHRSREPRIIAADPISILPPSQSLARFIDKTRGILADVQAIEKRLISEKVLPRSSPDLDLQVLSVELNRDELRIFDVLQSLLEELKALRAAAAAKAQAQSDTAFKTFCEQLLLRYEIWKLEREAVATAGGEGKDPAPMGCSCHAHREADGCGCAEGVPGGGVRQESDRNWMKEHARMKSGLAQKARLLEHDMSNTMEQSLFESLREAKRRIEELEGQVAGCIWSDDATLNDADGATGGGDHAPSIGP